MKSQHAGPQGRGRALPDWSIEVCQIAIAILITITAYYVLIQYGVG